MAVSLFDAVRDELSAGTARKLRFISVFPCFFLGIWYDTEDIDGAAFSVERSRFCPRAEHLLRAADPKGEQHEYLRF